MDLDQCSWTCWAVSRFIFSVGEVTRKHTSTGGRIVMRDFGSTGCLMLDFSSTPSAAERFESDLSVLPTVVVVSARCNAPVMREDMLVR